MNDTRTDRLNLPQTVDAVAPRWGWLPEFLVPPILISLLALAELVQRRGILCDAEAVDAMLRLLRERGCELPA